MKKTKVLPHMNCEVKKYPLKFDPQVDNVFLLI